MIRKELVFSHLALVAVIIALLLKGGIELPPQGKIMRDYSGQYVFTNPILDYEDTRPTSVSIFSESVYGKVNDLKNKYDISFASVYFRDLNNGQWIGVNEKEPLASASLIKLPVLISVLAQSEKESGLLDKKVTITEDDTQNNLVQNIKPEKPVTPGETYNVEGLAEKMIIDSDNTATHALLRIVPENRKQVYKSIGVKFEEDGDEVMVNVKNYAGFFRVLFNASYLSRIDSEKALKILSETKFTQGLVAGVPPGIVVAHKFGERSTNYNGLDGSRQLHDCGIIYYPDNPYILCVMTRGRDFVKQEAFIADMSRYFYSEVKKSLSSTGLLPF